jgi:long-subunit fatty acid transport protein
VQTPTTLTATAAPTLTSTPPPAATPRPTATRPPHKTKAKLALDFTQLQATSRGGHPGTTFRVGERFELSVSWRVVHLHGKTLASLDFAYQLANNGSWKTVQSLRERILTTNGANPYQKEVQISTPGIFRIVVTVKVKNQTKSRSVVVTIRR